MLVNAVDVRRIDADFVLEKCIEMAEYYQRCARLANSAEAILYLRRTLEGLRSREHPWEAAVTIFYYFLLITRIGRVLEEMEHVKIDLSGLAIERAEKSRKAAPTPTH